MLNEIFKAGLGSRIICEANFISWEYWQNEKEYGENHVPSRSRTLQHGVVFFIHGREWCSSPCIMAAVITPPHPQKSWLITRIERLVQCVPSGCPTAASLKDHIAQKKYTDISLCVYCCCIDRVRDCPFVSSLKAAEQARWITHIHTHKWTHEHNTKQDSTWRFGNQY